MLRVPHMLSTLLFLVTLLDVGYSLNWNTQTVAAVCECARIRELVVEIAITNYDSEEISISRDCGNYFIASLNTALDGLRIEVRGENLDHEVQERFECVLTAKTVPGTGETTADLSIFIKDCNDNSPVFTNNILTTAVYESENVGELIFRVQASDADSGSNKELIFSIDDTSGKFAIGDVTGRVTLVGSLDFEVQREHDFIVTVRDGGNPAGICGGTSRSTSNTLTVQVLDSPDTPPIFTDGCCQLSIQECAPSNTEVGTIMAFDGDLEIDDTINFTLLVSSPPTNCLQLAVDGVLSVASDNCLDRESVSSYMATIIAAESHSPSLNTFRIFTIQITDCNDQVPMFDSVPATLFFMEGLAAHSTLLFLSTSDGDEPNTNNSRTSVSILPEGNSNSIFAISNDASALITTQILDREMYPNGFQITLLVTDYGIPPLSSTQLLSINLTDINDNPPTFIEDSLNASVSENLNAGINVTQLQAVDLDIGTNGFISYRILSGNDGGYLRLDATTGILYTTDVRIDREKTAVFNLVVSASDSDVNPLQTTASVSIHVLDLNDNSPVFSPPRFNFSVAEEQDPSLISLPITVTDLDDIATGNGLVSLDIINDFEDANFFYLSNNQIRTNLTFDRESKSKFEFVVQARDNGNVPQFSSATVMITVTDINDNPPQYTRDVYVVGFPETADFETEVVQFFVTDLDLPPYNSIVFELDKLIQGFEFNTGNGILVTERLFNGRAGESFRFEIFAFDNNKVGEYRNASKLVKVIVLKEVERLVALVDRPLETVRSMQIYYRQTLENITQHYVNIENLVPTSSQNQVDNSQTEIIFHVIDLETQQVIDPEMVLKDVDERFDQVRNIFTSSSILSLSQFHVTDSSPYLLPVLLSAVSLLALCLYLTCCCFWVLFFYIKYYIKRVKLQSDRDLDEAGTLLTQQHAKSFSSLSAVGTSGIFSRSDAAVMENPLWIYPYGDLESNPTEITLYESKELILDLFSEDMDEYSLYSVPSRVNTSLPQGPFNISDSTSSEDPDDFDLIPNSESGASNFDFPSTSSWDKKEVDMISEQSDGQLSII